MSDDVESFQMTDTGQLERILDAAPVVVYNGLVRDGRLTVRWVSSNIERLLGYPRAQALAPGWWPEHVHPADRSSAWLARIDPAQPGRHEHQVRFRHADGSWRWLHEQMTWEAAGASGTTSVVGSWMDVTASKQQEEKLLESEQRFRSAEAHYSRLITTSPYAVYTLDAHGNFAELNPAAERLLGRRADEVLGRSFDAVLAPEARDRMARVFQDMVDGAITNLDTDVPILRADGEPRLISVSATVIRNEGRFDGAHGIARDITVERERDHRTRMLAEALDRLPDGVSIEHDDGTVIYANDAYRELTESGESGIDRTGLQALLAPDTPEPERMEIRDMLATSGGWRGRTVRRRADVAVPLEIVARRLELDNHQVTILLARDVTEQAARELQLRRTERLASIGTLIGGVAHELNNPLTAIAGFIELMLAEPRPDEERETLETMRRETTRVGKIVADLRQLARESSDVRPRDVQSVDLNDIIQHVIRVRRYALATGNIDVHLDLAESLPSALGVASEIEQIVLNLVVNASQSLEKSGRRPRTLTIRSARTRTGVAFEVIDNGQGIPEHVLERIFDPFFTTKAPGEGTGLGLSLVHSIVSEHGGRISVNSIEGRGAAFSVWLPLANLPDELSAPSAEEPARGRRLRVLVVDDEGAIRLALVRHLRRRGHEVEDAADGAEALERISREPFDVIVSDIRMPGMSGDRLLRQLIERGATDAVHRLLFMTGDPASEDAPYSLGERRVPVIAKPFTLAEITRAIERHAESA